jgi:hypothetical protein
VEPDLRGDGPRLGFDKSAVVDVFGIVAVSEQQCTERLSAYLSDAHERCFKSPHGAL